MKCTYNDYVKLVDGEGAWRVDYQPPQRSPKTFFEETCNAVEMVWAQRRGQVFVMFTGGLDTEYLLNVFLHMKMTVVPVIVRYTDGRNRESVRRVVGFCEANGLNHYKFDIDLTTFFASAETYALALSSRCTEYRLLPMFSAASVLDGTVLACVGSPSNIVFNRAMKMFVVREIEQHRSAMHVWNAKQIHGTPFALSYTAEQFLSYMNEPVTIDFTSQRDVTVSTLDHIKSSIYNAQSRFTLGLRKKFDPFEDFTTSFDVKKIQSLGYQSVCDYDFHKLRFHLRSQIP